MAEESNLDRSVLITQSQLRRFAGSEMVTLELVEHFHAQSRSVVLVTNDVSDDFRGILDGIEGVDVFLANDPLLDGVLRSREFSLVWIHHLLIPDAVVRGEISAPIVFNHMSGSHPLEFPLVPGIERDLATLSVFNSPETLERQLAAGHFADTDPARLAVFPNPAPDSFARIGNRIIEAGALPRLAIVSNHIPDELAEALVLLEDEFEVVVYGEQTRHGAVAARFTAEELQTFDAVVSIGKTVQYSLVGRRGVYCYDVFGGPGWITEENIAVAQHHNFSGRGFEKRSAAEIAREISEGWQGAARAAGPLAELVDDQFVLSSAVESVEEACTRLAREPHTTPSDRATLSSVQQFVANWVRNVGESGLRERARQLAVAQNRELRAGIAVERTKTEQLESARKAAEQELAEVTVQRNELDMARAKLERELSRAESAVAQRNSELGRRVAEKSSLDKELTAARAELVELRAFSARRVMKLTARAVRPFESTYRRLRGGPRN